MPERRAYLDQQAEVIEVQGLDLLAQVEALLRGVADYQRQAVRFHGTPKEPVSDSTRRAAGAALRTRIEALKEQAQALNSTLDEIERVVDGVARVLKSGKTA